MACQTTPLCLWMIQTVQSFDESEAHSSHETLVSTVGRHFHYFLRENGDSVHEAGSRLLRHFW